MNAPIARVSEIELHLLTIEALNGRVLVRVVGVATDSIREQIAADEADWEGNSAAKHKRCDRHGQ